MKVTLDPEAVPEGTDPVAAVRTQAEFLARASFEEYGQLPEIVIVFVAERDPLTEVPFEGGPRRGIAAMPPGPPGRARDPGAFAIRRLLRRAAAPAAATIMEVWRLRTDGTRDHVDAWERENGLDWSTHPDREELMMIHIERRGAPGGLDRVLEAPILRDGKKPRLGPFIEAEVGTAKGRYVGFLSTPADPPKRPS